MFALLGESKARVRTLIAPAGYGKTTLAEQWVARDGRRSAWFTARSASTDVAALALGIARSSTPIVDDCDVRLRAHLRALPAPAENVETLAEILGEDLAPWPREAWLVIDDYHEVASEPRAEDFVKALVAASSVQFLIASRVRPSWVSTKALLYGEILEVPQASLAMDTQEAADVLVERSAPAAQGLVSLAQGWPAVIGLASASTAEVDAEHDPLPESLYRFFADEVFSSLDEDVRRGLTTLALAPVIDEELAVALLGDVGADRVCSAALGVGLLVERGSHLDLHPLARAFLEDRSAQAGVGTTPDAELICLETYLERREWDAAFELVSRRRLVAQLARLMIEALDDLLGTGRIPTVERWNEMAAAHQLNAAVFAVSRAEVMLRCGRHAEAAAHAGSAAAVDESLAFRALSIAGRAAHLASREEEALGLFRQAESRANSGNERRDAKWGQLMCLVELESDAAEDVLRELEAGVDILDPRDAVRAAASSLSFQVKLGNLDLRDADFAATLLGQVTDPLVVSSFQSTYSALLGLACRYEEAREVAQSFLATIDTYRLDFATPYALCASSLASAGLRQWTPAEADARRAVALARQLADGHAQQLCLAQWMRVLVQQGRPYEALDLEVPDVRAPLPAAEAEVASTRAMALAIAGRTQDARRLVDSVRDVSRAIEPAVLVAGVDAICALKDHTREAMELAVTFEDVAFSRGGLDLLVTAYRASPELLSVLLKASPERERLAALIRRVRDGDLAQLVGHHVAEAGDRRATLSHRELDVYGLLVQDLKNREIAKLLFIEESTVKAHVHRIYDKLGVRSRRALIVQALLEQANQATSATTSGVDEVSS